MDHPAVIVHVALVFPFRQLLTRAFLRLEIGDDGVIIGIPSRLLCRIHIIINVATRSLQIGIGMDLILLIGHLEVINNIHILDDAHLLLSRSRPTRIIVVEVFGQRKGHIVVKPQVAGVGHPSTMRRLVMQQEAEGFILVPLVAEPIQRQVSRDVGGIAFDLPLLAIINESRIVVIALTYQDVPIIETGRIGGQVPLPDHRRLVTCLAQQLREGLLRAIKGVLVIDKAILVAMLSRQHAGPAGSTDGIGHKTIGETNAILSDTVDVGCLDVTPIIGTQCLKRMVIRHDVEDVQRLLRGLFPGWLAAGGSCQRRNTCQKVEGFSLMVHGKRFNCLLKM